MPKKSAKPKKQKSMEETLWESANKLRGTVEPSEYKHVVLGLCLGLRAGSLENTLFAKNTKFCYND